MEAEKDIEALRNTWRLEILERLVLRLAFQAPVLAGRISAKESCQVLLGWLDENADTADKVYGEHFGDPARAALHADEVRELIDEMKKIVEQAAADWMNAGLS